MAGKNKQWLGELPSDWSTPKMNYICEVITDYTASGSFASLAENVIYRDTEDYAMLIRTADLSKKRDVNPVYIDEKAYNFLNNSNLFGGELIMSNVGSVGDVYLYEPLYEKSSLAPNAIMVRAYGIEKFLFYLFSTKQAVEGLLSITNTTTQPKFNKTQLRSFRIPYPSLKDIKKISNFLDKKTKQIENIKNTIIQEIQTIEDYKKSVITEAVTKGLDKNVEMKDSGIEWIGDIPKHWKVVALKYFSENYSGGTPSRNKIEYWEDGKIPWVSSGEINKEYIYDTYEHITELGLINSSAKIFPENTVLVALNGQGKTKGKTAVLKIRATTNQSLTGFICDEINLHYKFLYYQFKGSYKFNRSYYSGGDNRDGIAASNLKTARLSLPNISEQKEIVKYLDEKTKLIDESIEAKQKQLEILNEYKKSLIYEYVTGKKEVL